jgi:hypothetical protein
MTNVIFHLQPQAYLLVIPSSLLAYPSSYFLYESRTVPPYFATIIKFLLPLYYHILLTLIVHKDVLVTKDQSSFMILAVEYHL